MKISNLTGLDESMFDDVLKAAIGVFDTFEIPVEEMKFSRYEKDWILDYTIGVIKYKLNPSGNFYVEFEITDFSKFIADKNYHVIEAFFAYMAALIIEGGRKHTMWDRVLGENTRREKIIKEHGYEESLKHYKSAFYGKPPIREPSILFG